MQNTTDRVGIRALLEAGVHFGHQAKRWNPKMKRYIFAQRAGVHIIDLDQTITLLENALKFVRGVAEANKDVLFVGTKKQAQVPLAERVEATPEEEKTGKDWFALNREYQKLRRNFAGITEMERLPGAIFVVDPKREELMIKEANRLKIPVVALTDTNCDPEVVDYVIPGNDDAIRSIGLISRLIADAIVEGRGEEAPAGDRPLPPVIEEAQVNEEVEAAKASTNGNGAAEPADEPPAETAAAEEPEAATDEAATVEAPTTEPADEAAADEPVAEAPPAEAPSAEAPSAEAPAADELAVDEPVAEEAPAEEPGAADVAGTEDGQENEQSERG